MYTETDLQLIRGQLKRRFIVMLIPCLALLAGVIASLVLRVEWITTLCTCLLGAVLIFCYDLLLKPLRCYETHVNNVLHGRVHDIEGTFKSLAGDVSQVDGVDYRSFLVTVSDQLKKTGEDDRMFYFDCAKPFPALTSGDRVKVTYHDREVADLVRLG